MRPVPPFVVASVPPRVKVPADVIGPPVNVIPVEPPEAFILVTVPTPETLNQYGFAPVPPDAKT